MRRLVDDRGTVTVAFGLVLMGVFLPLMLVAGDYGRILVEKRQLQNSADAAAYAVAFDCARSVSAPLLSVCADGSAQSYANANDSHDENTKVQSVEIDQVVPCLDTSTQAHCVRVTTRSREGATDSIGLWVSGFFDAAKGRARVDSQATAAWGGAAVGKGVPLIIQKCSFETFGGLTRLPMTGPFPPDSAAPTIVLNQAQAPCGNPQHPPGAHGWLDSTIAPCGIQLALGAVVISSSTGNAPGCTAFPGGNSANNQAAQLQTYLYHANYTNLVYVPIVSEHTGTGASGDYVVDGWAAMFVTGWNFGGQYKFQDGGCAGAGADARCIRGWFVNAPPTNGAVGGPSLGVQSVQLIK